MKNKKPNILFLCPRVRIVSPEDFLKKVNNNLCPINDWNIYFLIRKPFLLKGYKSNIHTIDMYSDPIYDKDISDGDIERIEEWIGYSFSSIMFKEDRYFDLPFKPSKKRKENIVRHILYFKKILKEKKIDFCFIGFPNDSVNMSMFYLLKKLGIPYWNNVRTHKGIYDKRFLYDIFTNSLPMYLDGLSYNKKEINKIFNEQKNGLLKREDVADSFKKNISKTNFSFSYNTFKMKKDQLKNLYRNQSRYEKLDIIDFTLSYIKSYINAKINNLIFGWYVFDKVDYDKKYFYFPLHYMKDYQISFRESFKDQLKIIKDISRSLPHNTYLYIKTHPHYLGSDYSIFKLRNIKKMPNVKIIHYNENNQKLIRKSIGVITINSTAGYEAIILEKPVITLGNEYYAKDNISIKVNNIEELPEILLKVKKDPNFKIDLEKRKRFIYRHFKNAFHLSVSHILTNGFMDDQDKETLIKKYKQIEKIFKNKNESKNICF